MRQFNDVIIMEYSVLIYKAFLMNFVQLLIKRFSKVMRYLLKKQYKRPLCALCAERSLYTQ